MSAITLRPNASEEEIAAVVAVLVESRGYALPDGYRLWRVTRLKALRDKGLRRGPDT